MSDLLKRRQKKFVLWYPTDPANPPVLIIGQIKNGNPPTFQPLNHPTHLKFQQVPEIPGLWELDPATIGLADGEVFHYWFEVDDSLQPNKRIQTTDPLAYTVDYRLYAPSNPTIEHPAAVIGWSGGSLVARDPNGESSEAVTAEFDDLPDNRHMVIYELPSAWVRGTGGDEFERAVGTFRDTRALVEHGVAGANFPDLIVTRENKQYLVELGINALELLPPSDSIYDREWGYGTSHYLAPDYELGYPEGHLSPTSNQDLTLLINSCHANGIRVFLDVVLGFMKLEPYRRIDFHDFYLENPEKHKDDVDAFNSRKGGGVELRNTFGASCPRYGRRKTSYDPVSGEVKDISPARQHMLTFLTRWMKDFQIDGIRMDSVENVANWDFIQQFRDTAHELFRERYPSRQDADAKFLVVGEELEMPSELISQNRLDGLWNEAFQGLIRSALVGQAAGDLSFEGTVRRAINCTRNLDNSVDQRFPDGTKAINYLTSHDVEGFRKERLYNFMIPVIDLASSERVVSRGDIEAKVRKQVESEGRSVSGEGGLKEVRERADAIILHKARIRRIKLAFACMLTAVGIPMILAGEEFGDQNDLFDSKGNVTHQGGKQVDPVNYSRIDDPERQELFHYVSRLVRLRTTHPALATDKVDFIHVDFTVGKRVLVWKRGSDNDPVVVVANFSDFTTPFAPGPNTEYFVPNWPATPAGHHWFEVTQNRPVDESVHNREPIFGWEAKVYRLVGD